MDWRRSDPRAEIDGAINRLRDDKAAWEHQADDAHQARNRALALLDNATAAETEAHLRAIEDAAEIDRLLEERARIPEQR